LAALFIYTIDVQAAETTKPKTIKDIKPPFVFSISTLTPDSKPQAGVKMRCLHPRAERGEAIVDMVVTSNGKGVAEFNVLQADLILDRYFWFSPADEHFVSRARLGISPIDNVYKWTFYVLPAADFRFAVCDEDGKSIAGAKIQLLAGYPAYPGAKPGVFIAKSAGTTDEAGQVSVTFAQVETNIIASANGWASTFLRSVSLPRDEPYEITLQPGYSITGRVVDSEGNPITNVRLSSKKKDFIMSNKDEFILKATTGENGKFTLENATQGTYEIQTQMLEPYEVMYANPISVRIEGDTSVTGVKILAERGSVLKGRYVTEHKLRIADRTISVTTFFPARNRWETQTKNDGSFVISGLPKNTQGIIEFVGVSGYYASLKMPNTYPFFQIEENKIIFNNVPPGVYEGVEVRFLLAGRMIGKVFDSSGNPMPGHELVVCPHGWIHRTNDRGEYTAKIPPMEKVTLEVRDPTTRQVIIRCEPFRIMEGEVIERNLKVGEVRSKLVDQSLPNFEGIDIEFRAQQAQGKKLLVCFWDMEQRPSRYCIRELAKRASKLQEDGVTVVAIHASKVNINELNEWIKKNSIPFAIGMVQNDEDEIHYLTWGVKSLPWLILTDKKHIVHAEGFVLNELSEKLKQTDGE
jgi:hypothetical protein